MSGESQDVKEGSLLWEPSDEQIEQANLTAFIKWLQSEKGKDIKTYQELWEWSVTDIEEFWAALWQYFDIKAYSGYETVLEKREMPGARWFTGARLNFVDQVFRHRDARHPAIISKTEQSDLQEISWQELYQQTASLANALRKLGVQKGDRVAAYITNTPESIIAMLATASIGAIWSGCSPDFGAGSTIERFGQVKPKVLITVDGYHYGGKTFDRMDRIAEMQQELEDLHYTILIPKLNEIPDISSLGNPSSVLMWDYVVSEQDAELKPEPLPFDHPLWILYSSGTTGLPKPIVHGHGGMLLEHLKYLDLHADVKYGDRFFWYTTTGWMMWNVVTASLLKGATALLYDGSPGYPDLSMLWKFAEDTQMTCLGTSASYLISCMKEELSPRNTYDLGSLRSIGSTGSPLPPEAYQWVYREVGDHIMLNSTSGGTDICSSFVGGNPIWPVYAGEIQCRTLATKVQAYNDEAEPVIDKVGEMVITEPLPSMPLYFWGDEDGSRYHESYFEMFPGVWRHGDWLKITSRGTCVIYGRSDATLNRMGVRIGTSEIYRAVDLDKRITDSLVVSLELVDGSWYMPLFVMLKNDDRVDEELKKSIKKNIKERVAPRFIPDEVIKVDEIPYTLNGKKLEKPVKRILEGTPSDQAASKDSMKNPESLEFFESFAREKMGYG